VRSSLLIILTLLLANSLNAASDSLLIFCREAVDPIEIDGRLTEQTWHQALPITGFTQTYPTDTAAAKSQTEVMLAFDEEYLYVAAICYGENPLEKYVVTSLKRDFSYDQNDAFEILLNPQNDQQNGFSFVVNALGAQREGLVADGGVFGASPVWDNKWISAVERFEDRWQVEMAIPFKTLRYKTRSEFWNINFTRNDLSRNETSTWSPVPLRFNTANLVYHGNLVWEKEPPKPGANISLIPYVMGGANFDYRETPKSTSDLANIGLDAKVGITPSLNLDITLNPDFSQVEVDQQVINLDRFNVFFPERRNFFLENGDLFANFGFSKIRPFFSRRIGLSQGQSIPIYGGLRLSGNINSKLRIGAMSMQTAGDDELGVIGQNYTVAAFQHRVLKRSNIGGIIVNRLGFDGLDFQPGDYNTIVGLDFNIFSENNYWRGKAFYHQSFSDGYEKDAFAQAFWLRYNTGKVFLEWNHEYVGENYRADVGFLPRYDYFRLEPIARFNLFPKDQPKVNNYEFGLYNSTYWNGDWRLTDMVFKPSFLINFTNYSGFELYYRELYTYLSEPFDPIREGTPLPVGGYNYRSAGVNAKSDFRKPFYIQGGIEFGSFYNGTKLTALTTLRYRFQPWGSISIDAELNDIQFPSPYESSVLVLVGPKAELSFSKSVFFSTFLQYNTQISNLNINTRLQWRFAPMSDLYIVYTDNYSLDFGKTVRAFVIKLNYWFNI
jgi:hypothetical protein